MKRLVGIVIIAGLTLWGLSETAGAACGKITIGEMNWESAQVVANVEKFILQVGYGCEVELIPTKTVPCMTSMVEKGEPDIASEMWINSVKEPFAKAVKEGRLVDAGDVLSDGGGEAWFIPKYFAEANPHIKTIQDVIANASKFKDPENPSKGRFYNCPSGWVCKIINTNMFKAYGMEAHFSNFDPGSSEGLAGSIAKAYERKEPWFGYYWEPTSILGKYPMVRVGLGDFHSEGHECNSKEDCATPHAGQYPPSRVVAATTKKFADRHPTEFAFIQKVSIPNRVMNAILAWGKDNSADGNEMAGYFMLTYKDLWTSWVSSDVADKVSNAMQ